MGERREIERLEPYEHPEMGAQMRPCQTLGGYVRYSDHQALRDSIAGEVERLRGWSAQAFKRADRVPGMTEFVRAQAEAATYATAADRLQALLNQSGEGDG